MAISESHRVLRLITILAWIPAFAVLLPYGIVCRNALPTLLIIPMSISAISGVVHINNMARSRAGNIFVDVVTLAFFISLYPPAMISIRYRGATLGAIGITLTFANAIIHSYFILYETPLRSVLTWIGRLISRIFASSNSCPHCHKDLRKEYTPVPTNYDYDENDNGHEQMAGPSGPSESIPRPSTDDETARLV